MRDMNKKTVDVGNIKIVVCESEGDGLDVLLIHGNSLSSKILEQFLEDLS